MAQFKNLGDLIDRERDITKLAIIDLGGEDAATEYTYAALDAMTKGVARALAKRGFARGDRIAILSANRAEFIAAYFGIMRAGLVAVPVNYRFPKKTIHFIIQDAGAKLVFCDRASFENSPEDVPAIIFGQEGRAGFDRFVDPGEFETVVPEPREPAMFLYTSGSTGVPKGVVLSHQSHIWVVETRLSPDLERHRYLIAAPLYHMNALALAKLSCAAHATIVLLPKFEA
jgi:acyl-CoA synthetase (AMP-forming)/AMP-acid ligase II